MDLPPGVGDATGEGSNGAAGAVTVLVAPTALREERLVLAGEPYRHLFRARRLRRDEALRLVDGEGHARAAQVESLDRQRAVLRLGAMLPSRDPARQVELIVAAPRPERSAWLVEKATELGVRAVRFVPSERSVRTVDRKGLDRLRRVAAAALEQCGGARLPELSGPHHLEALPSLLQPGGRAWCLEPGAAAPLPAGGDEPATVLVGPEGGWTPGEIACLQAAGVAPARLGERILRVETAAVAAAALLLAR